MNKLNKNRSFGARSKRRRLGMPDQYIVDISMVPDNMNLAEVMEDFLKLGVFVTDSSKNEPPAVTVINSGKPILDLRKK